MYNVEKHTMHTHLHMQGDAPMFTHYMYTVKRLWLADADTHMYMYIHVWYYRTVGNTL